MRSRRVAEFASVRSLKGSFRAEAEVGDNGESPMKLPDHDSQSLFGGSLDDNTSRLDSALAIRQRTSLLDGSGEQAFDGIRLQV